MDSKMTIITHSNDWQQIDARHHLAPFTDYASLRKNGARVITHADGHYITDSDGHQILDEQGGSLGPCALAAMDSDLARY